ncbi:hypothetical protein C1645_838407, partial [Glomus cerebriforme]
FSPRILDKNKVSSRQFGKVSPRRLTRIKFRLEDLQNKVSPRRFGKISPRRLDKKGFIQTIWKDKRVYMDLNDGKESQHTSENEVDSVPMTPRNPSDIEQQLQVPENESNLGSYV